MTLIAPEIWEAVVDGVSKYDCYKYAIQTADGRLLMKADPYAVHQETRPGTASRSTTAQLQVDGQRLVCPAKRSLCAGQTGEYL